MVKHEKVKTARMFGRKTFMSNGVCQAVFLLLNTYFSKKER